MCAYDETAGMNVSRNDFRPDVWWPCPTPSLLPPVVATLRIGVVAPLLRPFSPSPIPPSRGSSRAPAGSRRSAASGPAVVATHTHVHVGLTEGVNRKRETVYVQYSCRSTSKAKLRITRSDYVVCTTTPTATKEQQIMVGTGCLHALHVSRAPASSSPRASGTPSEQSWRRVQAQ